MRVERNGPRLCVPATSIHAAQSESTSSALTWAAGWCSVLVFPRTDAPRFSI